jgi:hypothetical protein
MAASGGMPPTDLSNWIQALLVLAAIFLITEFLFYLYLFWSLFKYNKSLFILTQVYYHIYKNKVDLLSDKSTR